MMNAGFLAAYMLWRARHAGKKWIARLHTALISRCASANHAIRAVDHVCMANVDYGFWFTYALVMLARYTHVPHVTGILTAYVFHLLPTGPDLPLEAFTAYAAMQLVEQGIRDMLGHGSRMFTVQNMHSHWLVN